MSRVPRWVYNMQHVKQAVSPLLGDFGLTSRPGREDISYPPGTSFHLF